MAWNKILFYGNLEKNNTSLIKKSAVSFSMFPLKIKGYLFTEP